MIKRRFIPMLCFFLLLFNLSACQSKSELPALSGVAPSTVDVQPKAVSSEDGFTYDSNLSLADSFNQLNSLRLAICGDMYAAVIHFSEDSAWVPVAANKYTIGSDEFLAASYVMEIEPSVTAKKLFRENGFEDIEITQLDLENTWKITATKEENDVIDNYEYTVMYGSESDSYRFTLTINDAPTMMLAARRMKDRGSYAVQVWTPEGEYRIHAQDIKEGLFGFVPKSRDAEIKFPENDIYFDDSLFTNDFITEDAEYTFRLMNDKLYMTKDGSNYAIPLK